MRRLDPTAEARGWAARYWMGEGGIGGAILDWLLAPVELAYRIGVSARHALYDAGVLRTRRVSVPVLSVGNLVVGGTGKTPVSAWLAGRLLAGGISPAIAIRGYGSDEILVHRELNPDVPVRAAGRRIEAVQGAILDGASCVVLDDGFQHRQLHRDVDIVLVAAEQWGGRQYLLPRGPWREGRGALRRADLVLVTRKTASANAARRVAAAVSTFTDAPVATGYLEPSALRSLDDSVRHPLAWLAGRTILAVASLAEPRGFVGQLEAAGSESELLAFPDHHDFTAADVRMIVERAGTRVVVMTRKEAVKLRGRLPSRCPAYLLEQQVVVESGGGAVEAALDRVVRGLH